jgi:hypothetical protein
VLPSSYARSSYERMLDLELTHLAVDGCITKTPLRRLSR